MPEYVIEYGKVGRPPEPDGRLDAPAFQRNHKPIWSVMTRFLADKSGDALEIGSGTGQHVMAFAREAPAIVWWPSDLNELHLRSIGAWRSFARLDNVRAPTRMDVVEWGEGATVPDMPAQFLAIVCINVLHIAPWEAAEGLLRGAARSLQADGHLFVYGPFMRDGQHTASSNAVFDASLRAKDPSWGVRDTDDLATLAEGVGMRLTEIVEMPTNNLLLVFGR